MAETREQYIALVGTPNAGKTSVFNRLTGLRQKVGNYPGVTVDRHEGKARVEEQEIRLLDLPGCYSLYPHSEDERVVLQTLADDNNPFRPEKIIYILDASKLERGLMLLSQVSDLGFPVVIGLTMLDMAREEGVSIDVSGLEASLGMQVIPVDGRSGDGLEELKKTMGVEIKKKPSSFSHSISEASSYARSLLMVDALRSSGITSDHAKEEFNPLHFEVSDKQARLSLWSELLKDVVKREDNNSKGHSTVDRWLTHPIFGAITLLVILFLIFQALFAWATPMMDAIDQGVGFLGSWVRSLAPGHWLTDFLVDGIIAGLGGIVIFIPQIALLFAFIAILEESGYMSRAVYLSDRFMRAFGLHGRSLVSLISGVACAVPAIMAARTISDRRERLATIWVTPFMSCSARLPVYVVLLAFVVPAELRWLGFSAQGVLLFALYLLGTVTALVGAFVASRFLKSQDRSYLLLELPRYQWPQWRNVGLTIFEKSKVFVIEAGKVILVISVLLWLLSSFGPAEAMEHAESEVQALVNSGELSAEEADAQLASKKLEASYVGHLGRSIEPVIEPLGFDWKIGIALITSFAAREVFVGTMATIYSAGDADDEQTIIERLRSQTMLSNGEPVFTPLRSVSLILFYVFAMQCMSTLAIVARETKGWSIPLAQLLIMTAMAYLASLFVWQTFS